MRRDVLDPELHGGSRINALQHVFSDGHGVARALDIYDGLGSWRQVLSPFAGSRALAFEAGDIYSASLRRRRVKTGRSTVVSDLLRESAFAPRSLAAPHSSALNSEIGTAVLTDDV